MELGVWDPESSFVAHSTPEAPKKPQAVHPFFAASKRREIVSLDSDDQLDDSKGTKRPRRGGKRKAANAEIHPFFLRKAATAEVVIELSPDKKHRSADISKLVAVYANRPAHPFFSSVQHTTRSLSGDRKSAISISAALPAMPAPYPQAFNMHVSYAETLVRARQTKPPRRVREGTARHSRPTRLALDYDEVPHRLLTQLAKTNSAATIDQTRLGLVTDALQQRDDGQTSELWTRRFCPQRSGDLLSARNRKHAAYMCKWLDGWRLRNAAWLQASAAAKNDRNKKTKRKINWMASDDDLAAFVEHFNNLQDDDDDDWLDTSEDGRKKSKSQKRSTQRSLTGCLVLAGPSGVGKTACVYACAQEKGFTVFEINAGSRRTGRDIDALIGEMTQTHCVDSAAIADPPIVIDGDSDQDGHDGPVSAFAQSVVLIDEADIVFGEDKGFWQALGQLVDSTKRPIVLTCNDSTQIPAGKIAIHKLLSFEQPGVDELGVYLKACAEVSEVELSDTMTAHLSHAAQGDIRSALLGAQLCSQSAVSEAAQGLHEEPLLPRDLLPSLLDRLVAGRDGSQIFDLERYIADCSFIDAFARVSNARLAEAYETAPDAAVSNSEGDTVETYQPPPSACADTRDFDLETDLHAFNLSVLAAALPLLPDAPSQPPADPTPGSDICAALAELFVPPGTSREALFAEYRPWTSAICHADHRNRAEHASTVVRKTRRTHREAYFILLDAASEALLRTSLIA